MTQATENNTDYFSLAGVEGLPATLISHAFLPDEGRSETPQSVRFFGKIVHRFSPSLASRSGRRG